MFTLFIPRNRRLSTVGCLLSIVAGAANAATVEVGPGDFDDGWATRITYDDSAERGTADDRDNPLNALGANDGKFFEIGTGAEAVFTFGRQFNSDVTVYEVTFGNTTGWSESVDVSAGLDGSFTFLGVISNAEAQSGAKLSLLGLFDTIRLTDTSGRPGGFDIDALRVSPVPLPAAAWLFLSVFGAAFGFKRVNARASKAPPAVD